MESLRKSGDNSTEPVVLKRKESFVREELQLTDEEIKKFESIQYCESFLVKLRRIISKDTISDGILNSFRRYINEYDYSNNIFSYLLCIFQVEEVSEGS